MGQNISKISFLIALLAFPIPAMAEEEIPREKRLIAYESAKEIAECSAAYDVTGKILRFTGAENGAVFSEDVGRGAYLTAVYTFTLAQNKTDKEKATAFVDSVKASEISRLMSYYDSDNAAEIELGSEELKRKIELCTKKWGQYQQDTINQIRQNIYID